MAMNTDNDGLASIDAEVVSDPSDYETFVAVFARTYAHSKDPAAVVDLYHDYQQLRAKHPNAGSSKLSTKLDVPRSTIRKWVDDGAVPYVVQGLQTAETRDWIPSESTSSLTSFVQSSDSLYLHSLTAFAGGTANEPTTGARSSRGAKNRPAATVSRISVETQLNRT